MRIRVVALQHRLLGAAVLLCAATSCTTPVPASRTASVVIGWPQTAITSLQVDRSLVELVAMRHFGYNALDEAQRERLCADLARSRLSATLDQAVCVRNLLYKLQLDTQRAVLSPQQMAQHYATTAAGSLAACAAHFQTAPLEVARAIVRYRYRIPGTLTRRVVELTVSFVGERPGAGSAEQLRAFRSHLVHASTERRLSAQAKRDLARFAAALSLADWRQVVWACQHDMQGRPKEVTIGDAEAGERVLAQHLTACGVRFRTEQDLRRQQDEARRSTPDFLFDDPPSIICAAGAAGGAPAVRSLAGPVCWLDMKNQYGTVSCGPASDALVAQLAAKAARYTADWGPGAFVLKYGFCEALSARLGELMGSQAGLVGLLSADSLPPLAVADGECELATGLGVTDDLKGGYSTGSDTHGRHSSSDSDFDSLTVSEGR